jgi:sulfur relay (sulfurtransferase) complex TusBCD TusD component (DsrE family)
MKHKLVFGLCITVFLLAGAVIASVALMLFERQDIALLQHRITQLSNENAALRHQLENTARRGIMTQDHNETE